MKIENQEFNSDGLNYVIRLKKVMPKNCQT
jgi:hypothetical protein